MDNPTISPVIPRIGQQIRLSISFAKSSADLRVFISRLQQHRFQFQKCAQQLVRMNDVAFAVAFVGVNNPSPAVFCQRATIAARPTRSVKLVGTFEGGNIESSKRSVTLRLEYRSDDRTLRDEEVEESHSRVTAALLQTFAAEQR